jgi:TatD DNase family protein
MQLVNFHTHLSTDQQNVISVRSLFVSEASEIETTKYYTMGIHPWYSHANDITEQLEALKELAKKSNVIGIGEIGLDKFRGPSLDIQTSVLIKQLDIAIELQKPVIIHCVKAWDELIQIKKMYSQINLKWAIHGYRGNATQARQLISLGFYLSYGKFILSHRSKEVQSLETTPFDQLFFETDESDTPIHEIYSCASQRLNKSMQEVVQMIYENFRNFYALQ